MVVIDLFIVVATAATAFYLGVTAARCAVTAVERLN